MAVCQQINSKSVSDGAHKLVLFFRFDALDIKLTMHNIIVAVHPVCGKSEKKMDSSVSRENDDSRYWIADVEKVLREVAGDGPNDESLGAPQPLFS